jgi:large subunit ribosomal protein L30
MHIQLQATAALVWIKYLTVNRKNTMATIKIKQIKSKIGYPVDQKRTLLALGLHKISQVVEVEDTPSIRGMIRKVHHLVNVVE